MTTSARLSLLGALQRLASWRKKTGSPFKNIFFFFSLFFLKLAVSVCGGEEGFGGAVDVRRLCEVAGRLREVAGRCWSSP